MREDKDRESWGDKQRREGLKEKDRGSMFPFSFKEIVYPPKKILSFTDS